VHTNLNSPHSAARQFVEIWGGPIVLNAWLKGAVALLSVLVLVLAGGLVHATSQAAQVKPLVVRIDAIGRAEAVSYDAATWKPQTPELRYFLTRFVTLHFARMRGTIARDFPNSLMFLSDGKQAEILGAAGKGSVESFVQDPTADERDIEVKNVTFSDLSTPPYQASVDFVALDYGSNSRQARKTETFTAQVAFVLRDSVPNAYVPVNPLGLQITQLRVDQAFD
jgi:type IV secretory pathway TrbF-like protein